MAPRSRVCALKIWRSNLPPFARLRCLGSEFLWDRSELWTETRFEVLEHNKGLLPGIVTVRTIGGISGHLHSHVDASPYSVPAKRSIHFCGSAPASFIAYSAGRKAPFASRAMWSPATKRSRKIPPWPPSSTRAREPSGTAESAIYL